MYGSLIKIIRERYKLSRNDLADKIGISTVAVGRIENDQTNPSIDTLKSLVEHFNINVENFIFNKGSIFKQAKITRVTNNSKINNKSLDNELNSDNKARNKDKLSIGLDKNSKPMSEKELSSNNDSDLKNKLISALEQNIIEKDRYRKVLSNIIGLLIKDDLKLENVIKTIYEID